MKVPRNRWINQVVKRPATLCRKVFRPVTRPRNNNYWHFCFIADDQLHDVLVFAIVHAVIANYDGNFVPGQNHPALGHSGSKQGGERALPKDVGELSTNLVI
ncbi:MAG: hypothetical protein WB660_15230 [Candidatus Sulfotelmatobacter sp.]